MGVFAAIQQPACAVAPMLYQSFNNPLHWFCIIFNRAEIPAFCKLFFVIVVQMLCQDEIAMQRLEDMLPWPGSMWVANYHRLLIFKGFQNVGDQPVFSPIAPAYYVTCAHTGQSGRARCAKKRFSICTGHQFSAALAVAIRVVPAHRFVFTVAPFPFAVLVALVGGYVHNRFQASTLACGFEHVHRTHDIGGISFHRLAVA